MTLYLIIDFYLILIISTFYLISCRFFSNKYIYIYNLSQFRFLFNSHNYNLIFQLIFLYHNLAFFS